MEETDPSAKDSDTVLAVGEPIPYRYYDTDDEPPFCKLFQINPSCGGDINRCDVLMNAPDHRDGYK